VFGEGPQPATLPGGEDDRADHWPITSGYSRYGPIP
jgi:hypothetical protein